MKINKIIDTNCIQSYYLIQHYKIILHIFILILIQNG